MHPLDPDHCVRPHSTVRLLVSTALTLTAGIGAGFWSAGVFSIANTSVETTVYAPDSERAATEFSNLLGQVGRMQAELLRLNALGERLVETAGLDPDEFDFSSAPPQGGADAPAMRDYTIKELVAELGNMVSMIQDREHQLNRLDARILERKPLSTGRSAPSRWPVKSGYITSTYGYRIHPTRKTRTFHTGVDFSSPYGTPILATADGVVIFSGRRNGYGRVIDIRHDSGLVTRYAHNAANLVEVGERVRKGQQIAKVGSSGIATGPHVHFEVIQDGETINPMRYLDDTPKRMLADGRGAEGAG